MKISDILKYRSVWMGLAMLWVILFHAGVNLPGILFKIKEIGYGGVDIFLFASGAGCYYSLRKNEDYFEFIKRRVIRLIPTYWSFLLVWVVYKIIISGMPLQAIIGNFLCVQNFTGFGNDFNWYISAIWLLYLLAPFFKRMADRINKWSICLLYIIILCTFSVPFWQADTYIITVTRIPIFFIGVYFAKLSVCNKLIDKKNAFFLLISTVIGIISLEYVIAEYPRLLWSYGLWWYPFILITPGICFIISYVMAFVENTKWGKVMEKALTLIGMNSFEIYLVHILLFDIFNNYFFALDILPNNSWTWIVVIIMVFPCCFLLKIFVTLIKKFINFVSQMKTWRI